MLIAITGSTGLVGTALTRHLESAGHQVHGIRRGSPGTEGADWDPDSDWIADGALEGYDAVVHLAGASIGEGRWTRGRKRVLRESRVDATRLLVSHLATLSSPPRVLISASGINYYGGRGDDVLDESSTQGEGFLADLVGAWETEALRARDLGIRVVTPRFAVILDRDGGALPRMMLPVHLGVGGPLGSGTQWMPWVTLTDAVRAIEFLLAHEVHGAVNVVAPGITTNREFTKALASALHRPAVFPTPGFALRLILGQSADELLLASMRAVPTRLVDAGFRFEHPTLQEALPAVLRGEGRRDLEAAQV